MTFFIAANAALNTRRRLRITMRSNKVVASVSGLHATVSENACSQKRCPGSPPANPVLAQR